eukprot:2521512-Rhodomonas_salina.2
MADGEEVLISDDDDDVQGGSSSSYQPHNVDDDEDVVVGGSSSAQGGKEGDELQQQIRSAQACICARGMQSGTLISRVSPVISAQRSTPRRGSA